MANTNGLVIHRASCLALGAPVVDCICHEADYSAFRRSYVEQHPESRRVRLKHEVHAREYEAWQRRAA